MHAHRKDVQSSLNPSHMYPLIVNHCLTLWNNEYVNNYHVSTYKNIFHKSRRIVTCKNKTPFRFFDSGPDIASWTVTFFPWTPSHWIVRALSPAGNSHSLSHQLPRVATTAVETIQHAINKLGIRFDFYTLSTHKDTAELIEIFIRDTGKQI